MFYFDSRIMKEQGWTCQAFNKQTRKYNSYKGVVGRIAKNKLHRRFKTDRPYQKLVADVSEFRYGQMSQSERIYLEPIMDLFSGEILAFNISAHPTLEFSLKPLKEALDGLPEQRYTQIKDFSTNISSGKKRLKLIIPFRVCPVRRLA